MPDATAFVDEVAHEVESWPGVRLESRPDGVTVGVSHALHGPSDVTEVLALFDRRYREVRGEDPPYASRDSA